MFRIPEVAILQEAGDVTSNLGLLFDWNYQGKGMQIAEVIEKGPFDHSRTKVKAGCIIEKINGEEITLDNDITCLLNNKAGKKTLISIYNPQNKERWEEVVMPITNGKLNGLLYKRWVKQRAADVEKWSNGRLGYVHIQSMGDGSFRTVYSDILGKYNNCEGIVIDTRFNGGGRLHEDIEILFSGQKYSLRWYADVKPAICQAAAGINLLLCCSVRPITRMHTELRGYINIKRLANLLVCLFQVL